MPRPATLPASNLPAAATPLIGREELVRRIVAAIEGGDDRLVTLTGPGGIGKTRVAVEAATRLAPHFAAGAWLVHLSGVTDPELVPAAIMGTIGVRGLPGAEPLASLLTAVADRPMLLVLDNLEQVPDFADGLAELLARCPEVAVLATSRVPLGIRAERRLLLPPLADEAADLFADRARAADADFRLTDENRPVVEEICRRLDGLPLAIELAAARVTVLSPPALLARLADRLTPLGASPRDLPDRQRTLRGVISWSDDLLSPGDDASFHRLAIFSGRFSWAEALALAPDAPEAIPTLVDHSLLRRHPPGEGDEAHGETTFSMLQTIRAFGLERLDAGEDAAAVHALHASLITGIVEEAEEWLTGPDQRRWLRRLDRLQDDCRAVLGQALAAGDSALTLRLATGLWRYWETRGRLVEGKLWLERVVADADDGTPDLARALNRLGNLELDLGDLELAGRHYRASLALRQAAGNQAGVADTLNNLGIVALAQADLDLAADLHGQSLAIRRQLGDRFGEGLALGNLGDDALARGEPARALALHAEARAIYEELGDDRRLGYALANIAEAHLFAGAPDDIAAAEALLADAGALFDGLAEPTGQALVLLHLGAIPTAPGEAARAVRWVQGALRLRRGQGQAPGMVECVERVGGLTRDPRLLSAADAIRSGRGWPRTPVAEIAWQAALRSARAATTARAFTSAWESGRSLPLGEAAELALAEPAAPALHTVKGVPRPKGLSVREVEVLLLVADGLTNAEIGERLYISPTTISAHLRAIYPKLGVSNRAGAATFAVVSGLTGGPPVDG